MTAATDFAVDILAQLGLPAARWRIDALVMWQAGEGTTARFNPLATTQPMPGSTPFNANSGWPVRNYATYSDGIAATVATLRNGHYPQVLAALADGTTDSVLQAVAASPWGTKHFGRPDWPGLPANARGGTLTSICPFAAWRPVPSHGGPMAEHRGLVLHVQVGGGSCYGEFFDPRNQASSTWWVGKDGTLEQYVDADMAAWTEAAGNSTWDSVETEGQPGDPLTGEQVAMLARLYAWGHQVYGWPFQLSETPDQHGFGWHGMGGAAWGGHTGCPGDLRKAQRPQILALAQGGNTSNNNDRSKRMYLVKFGTGGGWGVITANGGKFHVAKPSDIAAFTRMLGEPHEITQEQWEAIGWAEGAIPG